MEKYGFVYLWYDKKHKKYYVGSHWGTENDGYICSSNAMREAYKRRYKDFKRRILAKIVTNRIDLLSEEQRWLDMIKSYEFGIKYYNISCKAHKGQWWLNEETKKLITQKNNFGMKGKKQPKSFFYKRQKTWKKKIANGWINPLKGRSLSETTKEKISLAGIGRQYSQESLQKMSIWQKGKPKSQEHRQKISLSHIGKHHSEQTKKKMSLSHRKRLYDLVENEK